MSYALFNKILKAKSEEEVEKIIESDSVLSNEDNWKPIGGFRGNFSQIHNQQVKAIPALVEKPINSLDALLIKECRLRGIDPESDNAPNSIHDAIEEFLDVKNADFSLISEKERRNIAESVQIIATGEKTNPNICIYDDGEGQHPTKFEDTFLSLSKDNKLKIKFVQGKYNMGGTGAIPNCGKQKYQLIISRKHPKLLKSGQDDCYGFTITRLHKVTSTGEYKNSWYEYCVNSSGDIFSFTRKDLDVGLFNRKFTSGTFIKLFNYDLPRKSDITLGLWSDLNRYLYSPALPILLFENRDCKGKNPDKMMLGNRLRIMIDNKDLKEKTFPISVSTGGVKFPGEITVFKDGVDKNEFVEKMAVIFTINGQVHDFLTNSFISHTVKLTYLSGSILANFDCSGMPTDIREEIFMPSRDRMRENDFTRQLKKNISKEMRDNSYLRQLNEKRRDQKIFQNSKDDDFMKRIMRRLLNKNDDISKILGLKGDIRNKITKMLKNTKDEGKEVFKGKRFPSYMKLKRIADGNVKAIPQNGECKLLLETDAEDEYLLRTQYPGDLKIKFDTLPVRIGGGKGGKKRTPDEEIFDTNIVGPNQGEIMIRMRTKQEISVGEEVPLDITLTSPCGDITTHVNLKIINPIEKEKKKETKTKDSYSLIKDVEVYKEKKGDRDGPIWSDSDYNWTGADMCKVFPSGEKDHPVDAVAINMDGDILHEYMRQRKLTDKNVEHMKRLFKFAMYLISIVLYFQVSNQDEIEEKEEMVSYLMKGVGQIILHIVINDEIMKEIEKD